MYTGFHVGLFQKGTRFYRIQCIQGLMIARYNLGCPRLQRRVSVKNKMKPDARFQIDILTDGLRILNVLNKTAISFVFSHEAIFLFYFS